MNDKIQKLKQEIKHLKNKAKRKQKEIKKLKKQSKQKVYPCNEDTFLD